MKKLTTDELLKILNNQNDIMEFVSNYGDSLSPMFLKEYMDFLFESKSLSKSDVIKASGLDRTYCYQLFNGTKSPSRDKIIALSFGFHLDCSETNRFLKLAGFSELYPKVQRDSCIIFALNKKYDIITANEFLSELGEKILN